MRLIFVITFAILFALSSPQSQPITFSEHISPIIYANCTSCHRQGEIGPMPFTNYNEVAAYAAMIRFVTQTQYMPPWKPDRAYSQHIGERGLTQKEIDVIAEWVDGGFPQGDPTREATTPSFPDGSALGTPDLVLTMQESFTIRGDNKDHYQVFVIPTKLTEHRAIAAIEFRPGNRRIVHHALIAADTTGSARQKDLQSPEYGYESFGGFGSPISVLLPSYTPGAQTISFPQGVGQILPKNSDLLIQVHYAPWPISESDQSSVNIFFKKEPLEREVGLIGIVPFSTDRLNSIFGNFGGRDLEQVIGLLQQSGVELPNLNDLLNVAGNGLFGAANPIVNLEFAGDFVIPANAVKTFEATLTISQDISLMSIYPHMHLLGKSWEVYATDPQGNRTNLVRIPDWDFNWQGSYTFHRFKKITAGSKIHAIVAYDNTLDNPLNPHNPPRNMSWGEKTTNEMLIAAIEYVPYRSGDESIALTISAGNTVSIDFNGDGQQNFVDFVLFAQNYGLSQIDTAYQSHFDLSQNGHVDFADFLVLARIYGQ